MTTGAGAVLAASSRRGVIRSTIVVTNVTSSSIQRARPGSVAAASSPTARAATPPLSGRLSHDTTATPGSPAARRAASPVTSRSGAATPRVSVRHPASVTVAVTTASSGRANTSASRRCVRHDRR